MTKRLRLGVNIDHVATIRNARGGPHPDPVRAARLAAEAGADGITAHLREDRRHISDDDIERLGRETVLPLNLEMAATKEMLAIALRHKPHAACLVPERREERTTEGGLEVYRAQNVLRPYVARLSDAGIRVSLFIAPDPEQLEAAVRIGAPVVELHTGAYCHAEGGARDEELVRLQRSAAQAADLGLECHAGHCLSYDTVAPVAQIPNLVELNIGHFLIGEAIFGGLDSAIKRMRALMDRARAKPAARVAPDGATFGMIIGLGSDLIDIRRVEKTLYRFGARFVARCFTPIEQRKSDRRANRAASYAKRFAAKEACSKALGTGFRRGVFWRDLGVVNLPSGKPTMELTGGALKRLQELLPAGMKAQIDLTITDDHPLAQAIVVITAVPSGPAPV